jgi:hypothetical protein
MNVELSYCSFDFKSWSDLARAHFDMLLEELVADKNDTSDKVSHMIGIKVYCT